MPRRPFTPTTMASSKYVSMTSPPAGVMKWDSRMSLVVGSAVNAERNVDCDATSASFSFSGVPDLDLRLGDVGSVEADPPAPELGARVGSGEDHQDGLGGGGGERFSGDLCGVER